MMVKSGIHSKTNKDIQVSRQLYILIIANMFNLSILYSLNSKFSFSSWLHTR